MGERGGGGEKEERERERERERQTDRHREEKRETVLNLGCNKSSTTIDRCIDFPIVTTD